MLPLIFVDTETTHLDPSIGEIIEIAIIIVYPDGLNWWSRPKASLIYHRKIKPKRIEDAHPKALEINGYNEIGWKDARPFEEHASYISHLLEYGIIIGHNVDFDYRFIVEEMKRSGFDRRISYHRLDTKGLAFEHLPIKRYSMDYIRDFFGWSKSGAHTALKDAQDCKRLYFSLIRSTCIHRLYWKIKSYLQKKSPNG